jgi:general nucleoside transport system ATP-binding protein
LGIDFKPYSPHLFCLFFVFLLRNFCVLCVRYFGIRIPLTPALKLSNITKRFGNLVANDDISLSVERGEVLGLLGENGAGKSTLVSILFGHYTADSGSIEVFGKALPSGDPKAALAAGVGMVHQHFTLADNLSVLDNVMLGSEPLWQPFSRRAQGRAKLLEVAERFGLAVQPDALVANLSVGERQRVEIVKALFRGAQILILDEPTAVLTPQESEALFATLHKLVAQGLSVIFISHKLAEVLRVCQRVAVLRAGKLVATAQATGTTQAQLAQWMVGHAVPSLAAANGLGNASMDAAALCEASAVFATQARGEVAANTQAHAGATVVCALHGVCAKRTARNQIVSVNLQLHAGEIIAIAGVSGNGQGALAELLCGTLAPSAGHITLLGAPWPSGHAAAKLTALGVARIPEDRRSLGVVGDLPLWENAVSERLRSGIFSKWGWINRRAAWAHAQRIVQQFDVRGAGLASRTALLSGGNMQKLILGRALLAPLHEPRGAQARSQADQRLTPPPSLQPIGPQPAQPSDSPLRAAVGPCLIVAHQPTWGLDIGAVAYVHQQLLAARDAGAALLLISDDLDEVMALGDRIAVMHAGRLTASLSAAHWSRESLGLAMAGSESAAHAASAAHAEHPSGRVESVTP